MTRVGIVGTGDLGHAIAVSLARGGVPPVVHDVRTHAMSGLAELGCTVAASVNALASEARVVLVVVSDDDQLLEVVGDDHSGVLAGRPLPEVVLVHSTVSPAGVQRAHQLLANRGVKCLDAPVTGGSAAAASSVLTCLVGGDRQVLDEVRPVLGLYCREIRRVGDVGAGQMTKLVNNTMSIMNSLVAIEALAIAEACGLDPHEVREIVVECGTGGSRALAGTDSAGFGTSWASRAASLQRDRWAHDRDRAPKDLRLARAVAEEYGIQTPLLDVAIGARDPVAAACDTGREALVTDRHPR
jgi:3-hydroxyisobutyrate dehydrogenase